MECVCMSKTQTPTESHKAASAAEVSNITNGRDINLIT